jgi:hypothetical protein
MRPGLGTNQALRDESSLLLFQAKEGRYCKPINEDTKHTKKMISLSSRNMESFQKTSEAEFPGHLLRTSRFWPGPSRPSCDLEQSVGITFDMKKPKGLHFLRQG